MENTLKMGILLIILSIWGVYQMFFGGEKNMSKILKTASLFFLTLLWIMFILGFNSSVLNNSANEMLELALPAVALALFGIFLAPYLPKPVKGTPLYEIYKGLIVLVIVSVALIGIALYFKN
ncbi:MAG: hypothetical protein ACOH15_10990 [Acetobacterium sp.]